MSFEECLAHTLVVVVLLPFGAHCPLLLLLLTLYSLHAYFSHNPSIVSQTKPHVSTSSLVYSILGIHSLIVRCCNATFANVALRRRYASSWNPGWFASKSIPASSVRFAIRSNSDICRGNQCTSFSSNTSSLVVYCCSEWRRALTLGSSTLPWKSMKKSNLGVPPPPSEVTGRDSIRVMLTSYFQLCMLYIVCECCTQKSVRVVCFFSTFFSWFECTNTHRHTNKMLLTNTWEHHAALQRDHSIPSTLKFAALPAGYCCCCCRWHYQPCWWRHDCHGRRWHNTAAAS